MTTLFIIIVISILPIVIVEVMESKNLNALVMLVIIDVKSVAIK